ncbi:MAG TPA: DUF1015 domain-containing protein [Candidatus Scatomonas pullistercoris]|uniref:DUF1015 domain-containing protein n=1 Tax=Candidatus Scatomonas pullistercoris TaxID=2840920 RepID=A0A9D1P368_9FIRM|nr:DUF1015 domain-containing protein [Candidatus Scatomonas pullistercoris]
MARIRPFRALRPAEGKEAAVAALPYDVYSRAEAREKVKGDSLTFLGIDRPETQFPPEQDMYAACVYQKGAEMLREMEKEGIFIQDEAACFYIYELTMDGQAQTGLVACSAVDDYLSGVIKKHENTRRDKEEDRIRHVDALSAQTGPIFLAYRAEDRIRQILRREKEAPALADFTSEDGVRHRIWKIAEYDIIEEITGIFGEISHTYIADGHHRAASAVAVSVMRREEHPDYTGEEEFNYFLSVLFPDDELRILDYNRVLKDLNGHTEEQILAAFREAFTVGAPETAPVRPAQKGEMGLCLGGCWRRLRVRQERVKTDPVGSLDVAYLQREILEPVFGIRDPKTDKRIDFVGGIRGLEELERRCREDCAAAISLYPTSMEELFAVADAGLLMPPKSTWFEPKLRSGLFIHKIES